MECKYLLKWKGSVHQNVAPGIHFREVIAHSKAEACQMHYDEMPSIPLIDCKFIGVVEDDYNTCLSTTNSGKTIHQSQPKQPLVPSKTLSEVVTKFTNRERAGFKKYGETMDRGDLTQLEWAIHLQEELMDATLYIQRLIDKLQGNG